MPIREIEVTSLGALVDGITPERPDERTGRRRDTGVYRGAVDARAGLLTSLDRLGGTHPPHQKAGLEAHVLRNFIRYSRPHLVSTPANEWELLVTAQHYGVPTRLLDWTYSPLVAAHFATRERERSREGHGADRAVWRLDWHRVHEAFGLPPLSLLTQDIDRLLGGHAPLTPWRLAEEGDGVRPFACLVEPPSLDARIVVQSATFTLCSEKHRSFDDFLAEHGLADTLTKFVIPARTVPYIRDQLDLVGFDERRLFPDLDGVAAAIRRYYE